MVRGGKSVQSITFFLVDEIYPSLATWVGGTYIQPTVAVDSLQYFFLHAATTATAWHHGGVETSHFCFGKCEHSRSGICEKCRSSICILKYSNTPTARVYPESNHDWTVDPPWDFLTLSCRCCRPQRPALPMLRRNPLE